MNFGSLMKAFDTVMALRSAAKRLTGERQPPQDPGSGLAQSAGTALGNQIEARLTNVVVAALKEAFERDRARLDLERAQLEEERRRADQALRMEIRRQAADRELGRLRLLAATALIGWVASVLLLVARLSDVSTASRAVLVFGWLLLLGALASAFTAQGRIAAEADHDRAPTAGSAGVAAVWLLTAGLAASATSLLF
jgi:hypothetical protein